MHHLETAWIPSVLGVQQFSPKSKNRIAFLQYWLYHSDTLQDYGRYMPVCTAKNDREVYRKTAELLQVLWNQHEYRSVNNSATAGWIRTVITPLEAHWKPVSDGTTHDPFGALLGCASSRISPECLLFCRRTSDRAEDRRTDLDSPWKSASNNIIFISIWLKLASQFLAPVLLWSLIRDQKTSMSIGYLAIYAFWSSYLI